MILVVSVLPHAKQEYILIQKFSTALGQIPVFVVPYIVLQELDHLKRNKAIINDVKKSINLLHNALQQKNVNVKCKPNQIINCICHLNL